MEPKLHDNILSDPNLTEIERKELIKKLEKVNLASSIFGGVISKFFNLTRTSQVLLTVAGFGVGKYILEKSKTHDTFGEYDPKSKLYKINGPNL